MEGLAFAHWAASASPPPPAPPEGTGFFPRLLVVTGFFPRLLVDPPPAPPEPPGITGFFLPMFLTGLGRHVLVADPKSAYSPYNPIVPYSASHPKSIRPQVV